MKLYMEYESLIESSSSDNHELKGERVYAGAASPKDNTLSQCILNTSDLQTQASSPHRNRNAEVDDDAYSIIKQISDNTNRHDEPHKAQSSIKLLHNGHEWHSQEAPNKKNHQMDNNELMKLKELYTNQKSRSLELYITNSKEAVVPTEFNLNSIIEIPVPSEKASIDAIKFLNFPNELVNIAPHHSSNEEMAVINTNVCGSLNCASLSSAAEGWGTDGNSSIHCQCVGKIDEVPVACNKNSAITESIRSSRVRAEECIEQLNSERSTSAFMCTRVSTEIVPFHDPTDMHDLNNHSSYTEEQELMHRESYATSMGIDMSNSRDIRISDFTASPNVASQQGRNLQKFEISSHTNEKFASSLSPSETTFITPSDVIEDTVINRCGNCCSTTLSIESSYSFIADWPIEDAHDDSHESLASSPGTTYMNDNTNGSYDSNEQQPFESPSTTAVELSHVDAILSERNRNNNSSSALPSVHSSDDECQSNNPIQTSPFTFDVNLPPLPVHRSSTEGSNMTCNSTDSSQDTLFDEGHQRIKYRRSVSNEGSPSKVLVDLVIDTNLIPRIDHSFKFRDDIYEYRYIVLPRSHPYLNLDIAESPRNRPLLESEWRLLGIRQTRGWMHCPQSLFEANTLLFRRILGVNPTTGQIPEYVQEVVRRHIIDEKRTTKRLKQIIIHNDNIRGGDTVHSQTNATGWHERQDWPHGNQRDVYHEWHYLRAPAGVDIVV